MLRTTHQLLVGTIRFCTIHIYLYNTLATTVRLPNRQKLFSAEAPQREDDDFKAAAWS